MSRLKSDRVVALLRYVDWLSNTRRMRTLFPDEANRVQAALDIALAVDEWADTDPELFKGEPA